MPKRNSLIGKRYEQFVASKLTQQGFRGIKMTPSSSDYGADILCFDLHGNACAVQCKYSTSKVGYKAVEEALAGARYYNCRRALLVANRGFTKNAVNGANKLGVELYICFTD